MEEEDEECKKEEEWAKIQENTFTRWVNHQLQSAVPLVTSLKTDFVDGLLLIKLVETLSRRKVSRHNKKPTFRSQKLENVNIALSFLEADGLTLVNIDSTDIVDGKLKLILGLVWTLILHYSISAPMRAAVKSLDGQEESTTGGTGEKPKQQLLGWIQDLLPGVTNLRKGWEDGRQVGAHVDDTAMMMLMMIMMMIMILTMMMMTTFGRWALLLMPLHLDSAQAGRSGRQRIR